MNHRRRKAMRFVKHPAAAAPPAYRGDTSDHPFAPTKPLSAGPHAEIPSGRPHGRWQAAAYGPRVEGPDSVDTPTNGGSHGTPTVPGTNRPPGFSHYSAYVPGRQRRRGDHTNFPPMASVRTPRGTTNSYASGLLVGSRGALTARAAQRQKRYRKSLAGNEFTMSMARARVKIPYKVGHLKSTTNRQKRTW
ncbi:hypothetical protein N7510_011879 [Penicillium lagena]|nr:hypothetical protein N7510_011879 [Penicillium lagena]